MSSYFDLLTKVKEDYLNQRKGEKSNHVSIELSRDVESSLHYLIGLLKFGDCVQDLKGLSLFDEENDDQLGEDDNHIKNTESNDQFTGKTLAHLTINAYKLNLIDQQLITLLEFIDLCPNLEYLNLNLSANGKLGFNELNISKGLISLIKLKELHLTIDFNYNFSVVGLI